MKQNIVHAVLLMVTASIFSLSCQKDLKQPNQSQEESATAARHDQSNGHLQQTKTFSSDVAIRWMNMQIALMRKTTTIGNAGFCRHYAYSGIALYESVVPGMPAYQSIASQLNGLGVLPKTTPGLAYHWAASANAALAFINKKMFPNASADDKAAIDALEAALQSQYSSEVNVDIINRSVDFGRAVAQKIFD